MLREYNNIPLELCIGKKESINGASFRNVCGQTFNVRRSSQIMVSHDGQQAVCSTQWAIKNVPLNFGE